ncbi:TlpA disulfide reductase family protein [Flavivirga aquimarina]|uniref:TlpA disulfide reductase family protein n=1 Tax=Flavivirga aquimarina TaxID=2027862 RepID=A0ABT8WEF1_9FLAO|nr:TlpA disulfide reductase family protein [Flavivirga aquimarina]MDO5971537.1 TlpA disulfide reductase family protein [Flavivirga aquimarina]
MVHIDGFNKAAQEQLNALENPGHIQGGARKFFKDSIVSNVVSKIDSLKQADILKFETLYKKDSISKGFFDLVKLDRGYYYTALKGTVGFVKFIINQRNEGVFTEEVEIMWKSCFDNDLLNRSDFQNTEWGYAFAENYLYYKDAKSFDFDIEKLQSSMKDKKRIEYSFHQADSILPKERLEFYKASFLFENLIQKDYEKELVTIFNDFKGGFPNSGYTKYLNPLVDEVITFHETIKKPFNEGIDFVENYADITTFEEVLKPLKGEKLYVDFWATTCGPCKKEFKHIKELKAVLSKYGYKPLYISIDREKTHQQWLDMVKFYDLKGTHVRANETLSQKIREMGVNYIPRYFLVDEAGNIVENKAKNPSQLDDLEKQLVALQD